MAMLKTMKYGFIVFSVFAIAVVLFAGLMFFRPQVIPGYMVVWALGKVAPTNLVFEVDQAIVDFPRRTLQIDGVKLYDSSMADPTSLLAGADRIAYDHRARHLVVSGAKYTRLPDSYYAPENLEKNARVECEFPELGSFRVTLENADILAVKPRTLTMMVDVKPHRIDFSKMHLEWPESIEHPLCIDGECYVDLDRQEVYGDIIGHARQSYIRPMLVAIDVPVSLPYMDGFTKIEKPCKSRCSWKVDLVRNDLDLWLDLRPVLGEYNTVPMKWANGKIHIHNYTRGKWLNYTTTVGPITAVDVKDRNLDGSVVISGTNGYNVVDVKAKSAQPLADILKIGGFTGDYVGENVIGDSECELQFRFPRSMTNNYEVLNGHGHFMIKNGQLMRLKGFKGLIDIMPSIAPAVSWFSDTTQASCDYVIENGVVKSDNVYVEGSMFSVKMSGWFDAVKNDMMFTVRVQFTRKDSLVGKILHPITYPFTKLLLEFRMTGTPENPKWEYISVIDRVMEAVK